MPHETWADAYLTQAKQDFYLALHGMKNIPQIEYGSSVCMLLQMFFEKYAKAVFCVQTGQLPPKNHLAAGNFLSALKKSSTKYKKWKDNPTLKLCFDFIKKIESLQPANANKGKEIDNSPQLEYPWCFNDVIYSPAMDLDIVSELKNAKSPILANVIHFAKNLIDSFPVFVKTRRFL
ncbi:MAG: hypothetical protein K5787_02670 [Lentisphaeria bacterium]|nr:hypothetical protein [Victivallales bacterium]MCR4572645.1 hypothetical protein [Lentisphaeria bacterium]